MRRGNLETLFQQGLLDVRVEHGASTELISGKAKSLGMAWARRSFWTPDSGHGSEM